MNIKERVQMVSVFGSPMEVFLFEPEDSFSLPGIVLAQHIPGHNGVEKDEFTLATARRIAEQGYVVAVPFLFHWWSKEEGMDVKRAESRDDRILADMQAAFSLLQNHSSVNQEKIGIVGHCWGGRVAWLAACLIHSCKAVAVFYGGNIKKGLGEDSVAPITLAHKLSCPMIGFFGQEDTNPSPNDVVEYALALSDANVDYDFHYYDGAGHAFQNFPVAERYHQEASDDAWVKVTAFLSKTLS